MHLKHAFLTNTPVLQVDELEHYLDMCPPPPPPELIEEELTSEDLLSLAVPPPTEFAELPTQGMCCCIQSLAMQGYHSCIDVL